MMRQSMANAAGLWLAGNLPFRAWAAAPETRPAGKARSVIQIWMWGGPSHIDTFDPKPEAGNDIAGPLKAVETNVSGIRICELLPNLAKIANKYSLIRGMTHGSNAHETATYMVQTGRNAGGRLVYPGVGAVVSMFKGTNSGYKGQIPPYVVLTEPQGRFDEAGFLGAKFKPFATGGDPAQTRFMVEGIVAEGISEQQQRDRRGLLGQLDTLQHTLPRQPALQALARSQGQAYEMILGDGSKTFDLSTEKNEARDRYGRNTFGQSCLMARRLVERGVPYITINYKGWDTHKDHFVTMRRKLPEFDNALSALLEDLSARGLLDSTIVWCGGEFGRTPKIDWGAPFNGGRGHWGKAFTTLVAGGGFKGGQVVGSTDARGEEVKTRPVAPVDVIGAMYGLLGIDPNAKLPHPQGLDVRVMPVAAENVTVNGPLKEIT